jgi:DNA-binding SARP family transcriptional activator
VEGLATALQHRGSRSDIPRLIIDHVTAHTLLGIGPADSLPNLLTILDEPFTATLLAQTPGRLTAIASADPASIAAFQWAAAERVDFTGLLLGPTTDTKTITALDLAEDGRARSAAGPRARDLAAIRFHTLPYPAARNLLSLCYEAATPARAPASGDALRQETAARDEPDDPTHRASESSPNDTAESADELHDEQMFVPRPRPESHPPVCPTPLLLRLLGPITIDGPAGTVTVDTDRSAAILALLALNPAGRSAESMGEEIWKGKLPEHRPLSPIYTALQRTRILLAKALSEDPANHGTNTLISDSGRYCLNPSAVTTDLALQRDLEARAERTTDSGASYLLLAQAAGLYRGELADHLGASSIEDLMIARAEAQIRAQRLHLAAATAAAGLGLDHHPAALEHVQAALDIEPADRATAVGAHRLYLQLERPNLARASRQLHEAACAALGLDAPQQVGSKL